jgi:hypothetical protein
LSNKLIADLSDIWHQHGPGILLKMVHRDPTQLARLAYATLPKDILVSVEQRIPGGLSAEDWGLLQEVLNTIPRCHSARQQFAAGRSFRRDRNRLTCALRASDRALIDLLRRPNMFHHVVELLG